MTDVRSPPSAPAAKGWRKVTGHVAVRALGKSVLINMAAPAILYRLSAPHFPTASLLPLAISGAPPLLWLGYGFIKYRAIDFLGLFAAENVVVNMAALVLAHDEREALIGRAMQNVILAAIFLISLTMAKPLVFHMGRQLATGNDPSKREAFDRAADRPGALRAYRVLTGGWVLALLIKAAGSYYLGGHFLAKDYLIVSPVWDLTTDALLVTWSLIYGKARLGSSAERAPSAAPSVVTP